MDNVNEIIIDLNYGGYTYVGNAQGMFETGRSLVEHGQSVPEKRPYYNMYVISPVSSYQSDDYQAVGLKAEKLKCTGPDVWRDLQIGDQVKLFFDDKKRVQLATAVE